MSGGIRPVRRSGPRRVVIALAAATLATLAPAALHAQARWASYTNVRFAFAVDYPADLFTGFTESGNSDGATFTATEPGVELRAFGFWNLDNRPPRAHVEERYAGKTLSYSAVKRDYFVVSGVGSGAIFYDRCNFAGDRVFCFNLAYPAAGKAVWDKTVARIAKSLRPVQRGGQYQDIVSLRERT